MSVRQHWRFAAAAALALAVVTGCGTDGADTAAKSDGATRVFSADNGEMVIALTQGNAATVKKFYRERDGRIEVRRMAKSSRHRA